METCANCTYHLKCTINGSNEIDVCTADDDFVQVYEDETCDKWESDDFWR